MIIETSGCTNHPPVRWSTNKISSVKGIKTLTQISTIPQFNEELKISRLMNVTGNFWAQEVRSKNMQSD
jgi:hypothetical protein